MEIISFNGRCGFLEADVVEAGKGGAADILDCVVRYLKQNINNLQSLKEKLLLWISPNKRSWLTGLINSEHEQSSIKKQGGSLE
jgi:hypothetical protein